jgi:hypothetical protein
MTALAITGAVLLTGCGGSASGEGAGDGNAEGAVSRAQFQSDGKKWPLTVDSGTLTCESGSRITFSSGDTTYAVNGLAKGDHKWADIDPIWADDGSGLGLKVDIGDLISAGQALCD